MKCSSQALTLHAGPTDLATNRQLGCHERRSREEYQDGLYLLPESICSTPSHYTKTHGFATDQFTRVARQSDTE